MATNECPPVGSAIDKYARHDLQLPKLQNIITLPVITLITVATFYPAPASIVNAVFCMCLHSVISHFLLLSCKLPLEVLVCLILKVHPHSGLPSSESALQGLMRVEAIV